MKNMAAWMTAFFMCGFAVRNTILISRRRVHPPLSTWVIFLVGIGLSFITYAVAARWDLQSGILNTVDVGVVIAMVGAILKWGERTVRFKPFERWYLVGAGVVVLFWMFSRDAWTSNLFLQGLVSVGYLPTAQNLIVEKRNTESFVAWGFVFAASVSALYPAMAGGNLLATIYAGRTALFVFLILVLMAVYELRARKA